MSSNLEQTYTIDEIKEIIEKLDISKDEKINLIDNFNNKSNEKKREQIYNENKELIDEIISCIDTFGHNSIINGPVGFFIQMKASKDELIDKIDKVKKIIRDDSSEIIPKDKEPFEIQEDKFIFPLYNIKSKNMCFGIRSVNQHQLLIKYICIWNEQFR